MEQTVKALDNCRQNIASREAARYLKLNPSSKAMGHLMQGLQDDDFGVRWVAAEALAQLGPDILPPLLQALTDRDRVGDLRLHKSIYHVLHRAQSQLSVLVASWMEPMKGLAVDIATIQEAGQVLRALKAKGLT